MTGLSDQEENESDAADADEEGDKSNKVDEKVSDEFRVHGAPQKRRRRGLRTA